MVIDLFSAFIKFERSDNFAARERALFFTVILSGA
jgi:hypothetical protein